MVRLQTPITHSFGTDVETVANQMNYVLRNIKNDLDNGASLHLYTDVAGIANVDKADLENTQIRFYKDTSDSDKKWAVTKLGDALFKSEYTAV